MSNHGDTLRAFADETKQLNQAVAFNADLLADLLTKNIRSVSRYRLQELKQALQSFNATTGKWNRGRR